MNSLFKTIKQFTDETLRLKESLNSESKYLLSTGIRLIEFSHQEAEEYVAGMNVKQRAKLVLNLLETNSLINDATFEATVSPDACNVTTNSPDEKGVTCFLYHYSKLKVEKAITADLRSYEAFLARWYKFFIDQPTNEEIMPVINHITRTLNTISVIIVTNE